MDKREAKLVLQALRPQDIQAPQPAFTDALELAKSNPELKAWWEAQQAFDRKVAAKLRQIPVPEDLRATISAGRKIERFRPQPLFSPAWLAVAACVAALCAIGTAQWIYNYGPQPRDEYTSQVIKFLSDDGPSLGMASTDQHQVMAWLKARHAPVGSVPEKMNSLPTAGCQEFHVHGHAVSLICFMTPTGAVAHLFMVRKNALKDPPPEGSPDMGQMDGWTTASWSDGHMTYVLATQAGPDVLRQLL